MMGDGSNKEQIRTGITKSMHFFFKNRNPTTVNDDEMTPVKFQDDPQLYQIW
jgi:hypothetical protein